MRYDLVGCISRILLVLHRRTLPFNVAFSRGYSQEVLEKIEEISQKIVNTDEDQRCETQFVETHLPFEDGRNTVRLPIKSDPPVSLVGFESFSTLRVVRPTEPVLTIICSPDGSFKATCPLYS